MPRNAATGIRPAVSTTPTAQSAAEVGGATWAPLRAAAFRSLWLAQLGSLIGTWMQTVGAQWLLVDRPNASTLVALVQTANLLPALLLALPAGVIADSMDRRRLLVVVQLCQFVVATALTVSTLAGQTASPLLLGFTFLLGCGAALTMPAWQALIPDLVPREQLAAASALGGVSVNLARAVGPAVAGVLVAQVSVGAVFALNALSYAVLTATLILRGPRRTVTDIPPERFVPALRAGGRYIRHSLVVRRILLRSSLFVVPGTAMWALLPLVANHRLGLGPGGYGLLLAALGLGAVSGAFLLPALRARLSGNRLILIATLGYTAGLLVVALLRNVVIIAVVLVPAGAAWLVFMASMSATMQLFLPVWVRARALSVHQIVFLGGQGVAAFGWGLLADAVGLVATFLVAAALMALGAATLARWPLFDVAGMDRSPTAHWRDPDLAFDPDPDEGPVLVTLTYTVVPEREAQFLDAMSRLRRSRQRTGAYRWALFRDGADPRRFVELYLVATWQEHLRQHTGRLTGTDRVIEQRAYGLAERPPEVAHLFPAENPR